MEKENKFHALQLFTDTFSAETVHLTNEAVGIYIRLLCFNWTKNTKPETIETAKLLMQAGMLRKFVMSLQTLDAQTLNNIKRRNIDGSKFSQLIEDRSVSVSTELIVGLSGAIAIGVTDAATDAVLLPQTPP